MVGAWIAFALLAAVAVAAAVIDCRTHKVPNRLTFPAILAGLIWAPIWGGIWGGEVGLGAGAMLGHAVLAATGALIAYSVIVALGGLGGGDVKLMTAIGAISARWEIVFNASVYALVVVGLIALVLMVRHGIVKRTARRLMVAAMMSSAKVKPPEFDTDTPRIPFAVGAAAGGLLAFAEYWLGLPTPWAGMGL